MRSASRSPPRPGSPATPWPPPIVERNDKPLIGIVDGGTLYDAMAAGLMDRGVCIFRNCARGTKALVRYVEARQNADYLKHRRPGGTDF